MNEAAERRCDFLVRGMDCAEEIETLRGALLPIVGSEDRLAFDLLNARLSVSLPDACSEESVVAAIAKTGMRALPYRPEASDQGGSRRSTRSLLTILSALLVAAGFGTHVFLAGGVWQALAGAEGPGVVHSVPLSSRVLYLLGICTGLALVAPKAWYSARQLRADMNLLMIVAVSGAVAIGEWFEAGTVAVLFAVSLELEAWSLGRARRAISALMQLSSPTVLYIAEDGNTAERDPADLDIGDRFLVRPGDRIALDGEVMRGETQVDQAPITGESVPVPKAVGDEVFAGTINGSGAIEVKSTRMASDTTLARIVRLVGEAHSRRAPSEQWVDRFARVYTPSVMVLAALVFLVPVLLGAASGPWLYRALVLLVIACPCALVISTPVSIVAGLAGAAHNGVLIKGGVFLEAPSRLRAVAFDKTGTLTEGRPRVEEVVGFDGHTGVDILSRAASLEAHSAHPLARAIVEHAAALGVQTDPISEFVAIHGKGASAVVSGRAYWIGSHRLLEERGQETPDVHGRLEAMSKQGRSVVVVGNEEHVCGFIALADGLREETPDAMTDLRKAGIEALVMLTGDNEGTAHEVAKRAGVDRVFAELLPEDKISRVENLTERYEHVAMVGDGVNDAPAMARATIGIAMGAAGSDAAIETSDIALMSDDLSRLPWLVHHSRRTMGVIRANITLSLGIKAVFVVLTLAGSASLWSAIAADMGASLLVTFNGLRLLRSAETRG